NPRDIVTTLFRRFTSHHSVPKVTAEQRILFDIFIDDPVKAQQHIEALQAAALESAQASEEETSASAIRQISQETVITVEEPIITSTSTTTAVVTPTQTSIPIVNPNSLAQYSGDQTSGHHTYFQRNNLPRRGSLPSFSIQQEDSLERGITQEPFYTPTRQTSSHISRFPVLSTPRPVTRFAKLLTKGIHFLSPRPGIESSPEETLSTATENINTTEEETSLIPESPREADYPDILLGQPNSSLIEIPTDY